MNQKSAALAASQGKSSRKTVIREVDPYSKTCSRCNYFPDSPRGAFSLPETLVPERERY